jgi:tetratricopeptide (TPR) repeat protein
MRRLIYYALAFVFLVCLVVLITWQIGHIHDLRDLAEVTGLAAVGVATVMALFVAIVERQSSHPEQPPPEGLALSEEGSSRQIAHGSYIAQADRRGISIVGERNVVYATEPLRTPLQRPARAEHFTGREEELAKLRDDLEPGKVVTLTGPGGIGKTALAAEAIWTLSPNDDPPERFPDGIFYHTFYNQPQADLALEKIALAYGEEPRPTPKDAAQRALAGRRALLVLDGAEDADDLGSILEVSDRCCVLITSRSRRDAPDERQDIHPLPLGEGVQLLQAWAGERARDPAVVEAIYHLVGGLPLALRLIGRYLDAIEEDAGDYLVWLKRTPLEALDQGKRRHESVPLLLEHSLDQVSEAARQVLGLVGLLALAPFGAEVVFAGMEMPEQDIKRGLGELVNYGLLLRRERDYELSHALVRTYVREKHPATAESLRKIAAHYTTLAEAESKGGPEGFARLNGERAHMMNVLRECEDQKEWESVRQLAWALNDYLDLAGYWTERLTALNAVLASARVLNNRQNEGIFLGNLGIAYAELGQVERALEYYQQALEISRETGDQSGESRDLGNLGIAYRHLGQLERAIGYHEQALEIAREIGDRNGEGGHLGNLGTAYRHLGQVGLAIEYYEQALEISRETGDRNEEGNHLGNLGNAYYSLGQVERAIEYHEQALEIRREIGDRRGEGSDLGNLGIAYADQGQLERAAEYQGQALEIGREIGNRRAEGGNLGNLGTAYADQGQLEQAIEYYREALEIARETGGRIMEGSIVGNLGTAYADQGQLEQAIEYYRQALEIFIEIQSPHADWVRSKLAELET